jgi:hypothetical protein
VQNESQTLQLLRVALRYLPTELGQVQGAGLVQDGVGVDVGVGELDKRGDGLLTSRPIAGAVQLSVVKQRTETF